MQPQRSDDQRPAQESVDGRRDHERGADQGTPGVDSAQVADVAHRTVDLTANLSGAGGVRA